MKFHETIEQHARLLEAGYTQKGYDGEAPTPPGTVQAWLSMIDAWARAPKARVFDLNEDHAMLAKVGHAMRRNEKLGEFYSRTLLGRAQAMQMSRDEITSFCDQADRRNADEPGPPRPTNFFATKPPAPTRPLVMIG